MKVLCCRRAKAALACVVTNEEHLNEFWLAQSCVVAIKVKFYTLGLASRCIENREASYGHVSKVQVIRSFHKDKHDDADDNIIVFQMICKSVVSQLNVIFLIY